jgi:hypothetical protein
MHTKHATHIRNPHSYVPFFSKLFVVNLNFFRKNEMPCGTPGRKTHVAVRVEMLGSTTYYCCTVGVQDILILFIYFETNTFHLYR